MNIITEFEFWSEVAGYLPKGCPPEKWAETRSDREKLRLRIWKEKAPGANPYYPSNKTLGQCICAVKEIMEHAGPYHSEGEVLEVIKRLENRLGCRLSDCTDPLVKDLAYFATNHIITITRFAGGHRVPIENDTEIDLSVVLLPGFSSDEFMEKAYTACANHGAKLLKL